MRWRDGFTLLELSGTLVIAGLLAAAFMHFNVFGNSDTECYLATEAKMKEIQVAMRRFQVGNDRLPRPALRTQGSSGAQFGREGAADFSNLKSDPTGYVVYGAFPFQALGLSPEYAGDCWGNKYTYAVTKALTVSTGGYLDTSVTGALEVKYANGNPVLANAAYAVISHGANGHGAVKINYASGNASENKWCNRENGKPETHNCSADGVDIMVAPHNDGKNANSADFFDDLVVYGGKMEMASATTTPISNIFCWGNNASGQLGDGHKGTNQAAPVPTVLPAGVTYFKQVSSGDNYSCAVSNIGKVYCWGNNNGGKLGTGNIFEQDTPTSIEMDASVSSPPATFTHVAAGQDHSCAIGSDQQVYCWGNNSNGKLGNAAVSVGSYKFAAVRVDVPASGAKNYTQVSCGVDHTCALTDTGEVYCWGSHANGAVGKGGVASGIVATPVKAIFSPGNIVLSLDVGHFSSCALVYRQSDNLKHMMCWGSNSYHEIDDISGSSITAPVDVPAISGVTDFTSIKAGWYKNCGVGSDKQLYCRGYLDFPTSYVIPAGQHASGDGVHGLGINVACSLTTDGKAFCGGNNGFGEVGNGTTGGVVHAMTEVTYPAGPPAVTKFNKIASGNNHHCALSLPTPMAGASCRTPWGATILHGQSMISYSAATAPDCEAVKQTSVCDSGAPTPSFGMYVYPACN